VHQITTKSVLSDGRQSAAVLISRRSGSCRSEWIDIESLRFIPRKSFRRSEERPPLARAAAAASLHGRAAGRTGATKAYAGRSGRCHRVECSSCGPSGPEAVWRCPLSLDRLARHFVDVSGTAQARFSRGFTLQLAFSGARAVRSALQRSLGRPSPEIIGTKMSSD
jgi:hypothetical protein